MQSNNVIRFRIRGKEPFELEYHPYDIYHPQTLLFGLEVLDDAAGCFAYPNTLYYSTWDLSQRSGKRTRRTSKPSTKPTTPTA